MSAEEKELRPEGTGVEEALPRARVPVGDEVGPVGFTTLTPEFLLVFRDRAVLTSFVRPKRPEGPRPLDLAESWARCSHPLQMSDAPLLSSSGGLEC